MRPDISVIVPCYNAEATLSETLDSVRRQTLVNWEALCVDDGSTDDTPELLGRFARRDVRIRTIASPHGGLAAARNRALVHARAAHVFFLDADDQIEPDALWALLEAAREAGPATIVTAGRALLTEDGLPVGITHYPRASDFNFDSILQGNPITPMALVPSALLGVQPFDAGLQACEDWDLWLRLSDRGVGCRVVPRTLLRYRLRAGSLTRRCDLMFESGMTVLERWKPKVRDPQCVAHVGQRWAIACAATALAAGDPAALTRYWSRFGVAELDRGQCAAVASTIHGAYCLVRGAQGRTWTERREAWLAEAEQWLREGPLASSSADIHQALAAQAGRELAVSAVCDWLSANVGERRVVLYGLGTNGLTLLEAIRRDGRLRMLMASARIAVADDATEESIVAALGASRERPLMWSAWPAQTLVLVTPRDADGILAALECRGGRRDVDIVDACALSTGAPILAPSTNAAVPNSVEAMMRS
ncbi:MAG: glycosyltransferase [Phycisphaerae bacterium]